MYIESCDIPLGLSEHETNLDISIPTDDGNEKFDEGDYPFFISLTDKEGWSAQKGLNVKIKYR